MIENKGFGSNILIMLTLPSGVKSLTLNKGMTVSQLWDAIERECTGVNRFQHRLFDKFRKRKIDRESWSSTLASIGFFGTEALVVEINDEFDLESAIAESAMLFTTPPTIKIRLQKSDAQDAKKRQIIVDGDDDKGSGNETRMLIVMLDGSKLRMTVRATKTISQLWDEIEARFQDLNRNEYDLVQLYSRQVYSEGSMLSTLVSLNLYPVGALGFEKKSRDMSVFEKINLQKDEEDLAVLRSYKMELMLLSCIKKSQKMTKVELSSKKSATVKESEVQFHGIVKQNIPAAKGDNGVETRLQLTKLDGSKMRMSISDRKTISELWDEIEVKYKEVNREQYDLFQQYPRKVYDRSLTSTLASLCLSPSGNLGFQKKDLNSKITAEKNEHRSLYEEYHKERMKALGKYDTRKEIVPREVQASRNLLVTNNTHTLVAEPTVVVQAAPQQTKPAENPGSTKNNDGKSEIRIKLVLLDGSRMTMVTSDKTTLSQFWDEVEEKYKEVNRHRYHMAQLHPRQVFDEKCFASTLSSLGLFPSATLRFEKFYSKVVREEKKANKGPAGTVQLPKENPIIPIVKREVETRIQFTKLDGSKMRMNMSDGKTISQLWDELEASYKDVQRSQCRLVQLYPRKVFVDEDMSSTLSSVGLSPSANLLIELKNVPPKKKETPEAEPVDLDDLNLEMSKIAGRIEIELLLPDNKTKSFYVGRRSTLLDLWNNIESKCRDKNISRNDYKLICRYPHSEIDVTDLNTTLLSLRINICARIQIVKRK